MRHKWAPAAAVILACSAMLSPSLAGSRPAVPGPAQPGVTLTSCHVDGVKEELRCGVYKVFENLRIRRGRMLPEDRAHPRAPPAP